MEALIQKAADIIRAHIHKPMAASSDAHGHAGWGKTYTNIADKPTRANLPQLLANATYQTDSVGLRGTLYPKLNRLRKKFSHA